MAHYICEQCGIGFKRAASGKRPIRFCAQPCYHAWRKDNGITTGQFHSEQVPWNKDKKGIRLSPASEFKRGHRPANKCKVGAVRVRTDNNGKRRAFVKVAEPNVWKLRCVLAWEEANGPLPHGLFLHHMDRDTLNDSLTNLAAVNRASHLKEHRPEFNRKRKRNLRKSLARKRNSARAARVV